MQVDVEFLASSEGVEFGKTEFYLWSVAPTGAPDEIRLDEEVVGLVEHTVQAEVEGVCPWPGRKLEIGSAEDTCGIDLADKWWNCDV